MTKPQKIEGGMEERIELLVRKYLYVDPMTLRQWEDTAKMWGDTCTVCGKPMIPNKYADEFEKKILKLFSTEIEKAKAEATEDVLRMVGDILPYSVGFTGRFYALKDELLNSKSK